MSLLYDLGPNTLPELSLVTGVVALPNSAPRTASLVLVINFVKAAIWRLRWEGLSSSVFPPRAI
jgi:hypothetical protein